MRDKKRHILICYVFDEFHDIVEHLEYQFKYRGLNNFGFKLLHLNDNQARPKRPLEESISAVNTAYYCVGLIGSSLGGKPSGSNKTYIQHEIEEALKENETYPFIFTVGDQYWDDINGDDIPESIQKFLKSITENCTIGRLEDSEPSYVASRVLTALEKHIVENFCEGANDLALKDDLLHVSGFSPESVNLLEKKVSNQLKIIYGKDSLHFRSSKLEEYQQLAFEEMRLKNINGATKSLDRLTGYFDSDLVGNFWTSRLIAFHFDDVTEPQIRQSRECAQKVIAALDGSNTIAPIIKALCYAHIAKTYQTDSGNNLKASNSYIAKARSEYLVYDALEIQVENILIKQKNNSEVIQSENIKCAKILRDVYTARSPYYFKIEAALREKYDELYNRIELELIQLIYPAINAMNRNNQEISKFIESPRLVEAFPVSGLENYSVWSLKELGIRLCNYQFSNLRKWGKYIESNIDACHQDIGAYNSLLDDIDNQNAMLLKGEREANSVEDLNKTAQEIRKHQNTSKSYNIAFSVGIILIILLACGVGLQLFSRWEIPVFAFSILLIYTMVVRSHYNSNLLNSKNLSKSYKQRFNELTIDEIKKFAHQEKSAFPWHDQQKRKIADLLQKKDAANEHIKKSAKFIILSISKYSKNMYKFECFTVSAHNRQYARDLLRAATGLEAVKKTFNGIDYLPTSSKFQVIMQEWVDEEEKNSLSNALKFSTPPSWQIDHEDIKSKWEIMLKNDN